MQRRSLGKTGLRVAVIAFGAGPISDVLVGDDFERCRAVIRRAIERGVNWFDTAATYGAGKSEQNLGRALQELNVGDGVHVATKARLTTEDLDHIPAAVRHSVGESLQRLRLPRVTLLQLHNSITRGRGDEPTSLTPADVLGAGGVADAFDELRREGLVQHVGLTGIGQADSLREVVRSGRFETMQVPYHLLNPSAGRLMPPDFDETNYGDIIADCATLGMGVLAIRVFAGGALLGNPPSPHTFKTPFFPLDLYRRDVGRAEELQQALGPDRPLAAEAVRFALAHPHIQSAIIGFGAVDEVDAAVRAAESLESAPSNS